MTNELQFTTFHLCFPSKQGCNVGAAACSSTGSIHESDEGDPKWQPFVWTPFRKALKLKNKMRICLKESKILSIFYMGSGFGTVPDPELFYCSLPLWMGEGVGDGGTSHS